MLITNTHNYAGIGSGAQIVAGGAVQVLTDTDNDTVNFVGSPIGPFFNASANSGVGGAVMVTGYITDNSATVAAGANITADSLTVFANNRGQNIAIGLQGGNADGYGFNGAFTGRFVDNRTVAKVSDQAILDLGTGNAEVPLALETISQDGASFLTSVPQFRPTEIYDPTNAPNVRRVDPNTNTITLPYDHGLTTADPVFYRNDAVGTGGGANISGLSSGTTYYAIVVDPSTIALASSRANALTLSALPISLAGTDNGTALALPRLQSNRLGRGKHRHQGNQRRLRPWPRYRSTGDLSQG